MRVLVGTIVSGEAKTYAVPKFEEMARKLFTNVDVVAVVDRPGRIRLPEIVDARMAGSVWATEIVYYGKERLTAYALNKGYDALVWQGIDCYYKTPADFHLLLKGAETRPILGALVAGRNRPGYAVCRTFVKGTFAQRDHMEYQHLRPFQEIRQIAGYIGSDATVIHTDTLATVSMEGYEPWHEHRDEPHALGPEEYWMWSAVHRHGIIPQMDPRCRPWHAHETGLCARYPAETCDLSQITWADSPRRGIYVSDPDRDR